MFTGLVQCTGQIRSLRPQGDGVRLTVDCSGLDVMPTIGASIAVHGACLTVTAVQGADASFDAVKETMERTVLGGKAAGAVVNLEPAVRAGQPLDGHFVLGHVDGVGAILERCPVGGSELWRFSMPCSMSRLVAPKGSITIDGISLTVVEAGEDWFSVSLIPHTLSETTLAASQPGQAVNLEADVLARYMARLLGTDLPPAPGGLSESFLQDHGFA